MLAMQHCRCIISFYVFALQQDKRVAVQMPFRNPSDKINATCEISTAAVILKIKLINDVYHKRINITNNTVQLFDKVLYYLDIIINTQCKIYVRRYNYTILIMYYFHLYISLCRTYWV